MKFITKYIVSSNVIASLELWQESITRSDILQGQALFRGVKQLRRCLVILKIFEKFSFPSIKKDGQKTNRQTDKKKEKKKKSKKEKKKKEKREKKKRKTVKKKKADREIKLR